MEKSGRPARITNHCRSAAGSVQCGAERVGLREREPGGWATERSFPELGPKLEWPVATLMRDWALRGPDHKDWHFWDNWSLSVLDLICCILEVVSVTIKLSPLLPTVIANWYCPLFGRPSAIHCVQFLKEQLHVHHLQEGPNESWLTLTIRHQVLVVTVDAVCTDVRGVILIAV